MDLNSMITKHQPKIVRLTEKLAAGPPSGKLLLKLAFAHFDYAADMRHLASNSPMLLGMDVPLWIATSHYYHEAYQAGQTGPETTTELAITYHYSRQTPKAIEWIERTLADSPDFATAWFNAGVFYRAAGDRDKALEAFERYLELDPDGQAGNPEYARERIEELTAPEPEQTSTDEAE